MKTSELRLSWVLGRGYGDSLHKGDNQDLPEAFKTLAATLREKYGLEPIELLGVRVPGLPPGGVGPYRYYFVELDYDKTQDVEVFTHILEYARNKPEQCGIVESIDSTWPAPGGKSSVYGRRLTYWVKCGESD